MVVHRDIFENIYNNCRKDKFSVIAILALGAQSIIRVRNLNMLKLFDIVLNELNKGHD